MNQGQSQVLIGYLFTFMLAMLVAGCGGGGGDTAAPPSNITTPTALTSIVADAGSIIAVRVGEVATLNGRASSTSNLGSATYAWAFTSKPYGSNAALQNATTDSPSFTADAKGAYTVQLVVSAGGVSSQRAVGVVVATNVGESPTGPYNHATLSSNCVNCHNDDFETVRSKSQDHLATSNKCSACHSPLGFAIVSFVDHLEVFGNCSECHNGVTAIGKSEFHVPTTEECDNCHNTTSFLELGSDGSFDHTGIINGCAACHNGSTAIGKDGVVNHPDTTSDCSSCHSTDTFTTPYVDHSGPDVVGQVCASCHNGATATGQPANHPVTTADCGICHSVNTFNLGGVFDHSVIDSVTQPCASCHNDVTALGKPADHIQTTADCANCHNTESFVGTFVDHSGPDVVGKRCDSCHNGVTAIGKDSKQFHMPTTEDCGVCHTPGTFSTGTFDHDPAVVDPVTCESCHNNEISIGKLIDHIPTLPGQDCRDCHNTTDFAAAVFDHAGITNGCASCHNGDIAIGQKTNHIPTDDDCSVCHDSTSDFASIGNFNSAHLSGFTIECVSCHDGVLATGKISNHIAADDNCTACHNYADGFNSPVKFLGSVHTNITSGCEGCHNSRVITDNPAVVKAQGHLPTEQDCSFCHVNSGFVPASNFNHTGITGNCQSCHDGSFEAIGARGKTATPPHPDTTEDCGVCHNTINFADAYIDHTSPEVLNQRCDNCHDGVTATGKDAGHLPTTEDCRVCHVPGSFATAVFDHTGIVDNCASCHNGTDATGKSADHLPTTQDCSVCHNTTAFVGATFDHQGIVDNCASCHNGSTATGKPANHVPTNQDCSVCHQTTGFLPATFDHRGIVDNCASCHDGVFATGKSATHIATNQDCGVCHTTTTFTGAVFDHTGIVDNCASCHDGTTAIGMEAKLDRTGVPHIPTTLDCHYCHTTSTFVGGAWDHQGITGDCVSCHDGTTATGKGRDHFDTTQDCNICHSTTGWAPIDFTHPNNSDYPGDHNSSVTCISCHRNNSQTITYSSPTYAPFCAACHERDYVAREHRGTLADNKDCGRSGCHRVSSRSF